MNVKDQLSREITCFVQNHSGEAMTCVKFIRYELDLRMIAKCELRNYIDNELALLEKHKPSSTGMTISALKSIREKFCLEVEPVEVLK